MKNLDYINDAYENLEQVDTGKPTKEEYEKAKKDKEYFGTCLNLSRKRRNELIDELCKEREAEKLYMEMYEKHRDIIRRYELYEEIAANG
jgi:vacuolar-type H+-ATPase subunit D/Vma8